MSLFGCWSGRASWRHLSYSMILLQPRLMRYERWHQLAVRDGQRAWGQRAWGQKAWWRVWNWKINWPPKWFSIVVVRLTDLRQLWGVCTFLLAYQGWASPWPTGRGYSAVVNPVDVTSTIPLELLVSRMSPSKPRHDQEVFIGSILVFPAI